MILKHVVMIPYISHILIGGTPMGMEYYRICRLTNNVGYVFQQLIGNQGNMGKIWEGYLFIYFYNLFVSTI